ncbi:LETM1-like protein-domain-containing protein [Mucor mucedo]|uniref:LETM1-like protein-domain-containing protein n=1 Tax=Mucor mucedo TaxID=29922 RepID=UPI00221E41B0|nr:LETM1-like protein-domain-containing protein [Mucor mucedo]KAI7892378.1 LETM1-like protein-domain-containing protein [Mucor mucedo]
MWQKVKGEAVHYWHGFKLLGLETRISSRLVYKLLQGEPLSRRESRQLRRTTSDIARMVPFAVFLIVPFMEFLLPVALKVFPNMLPSTFENKKVKEEKKRKLLKVRLEMARFLQETIVESGTISSDSSDNISPTAAHEFANFFHTIRTTGKQPSTQDLLKIARQFENELTLGNLTRPQLVSMCRYMNMNAFGTDSFLRFQLRNRMRQIKMDDRVIQSEGIDNLTPAELNHACVARGILTLNCSASRLRDELSQWIELHLQHHVPSTLLLLSRAFSVTDQNMSQEDALRATFHSLPDNLVNDAELKVSESESTYQKKLEMIEKQEELIKDEAEQEEKARQAREEKNRLEEKDRQKESTS